MTYHPPLPEECPLCIRWHCLDCGHPRSQPNNSLGTDPHKVCVRCRSTHGEYRPVRHRDPLVQAEHRAAFDAQNDVIPFDRQRIRDLTALVDFLTPLLRTYHSDWRKALRSPTESRENNAAINDGNKTLLAVDDLVRGWVENHPLDGYHGPESG